GIEHDSCALDAGGRHEDHATVDLNFLPGAAVNVSHPVGAAIVIYQDVLGESVGTQLQILSGFRLRQEEPRSREKGSHIAATSAVPAEMASRMTLVSHRELRNAVREI